MAKSTSVTEVVRALAEPVAEEIGCWLWDVEYVKEGARRVLRITIDAEEGVTIDDCEKMHRAMDPILDEADPIEERYYLEVSSPGIERELRTEEHILACEGWDVEVRLYAPLNGSKLFRGVLLEPGEDGAIRIDAAGTVLEFPKSTVAKLRTYYEF
ncbi:MAG: ribosome maturation factor RimP [Clostridia bacterium]|nr:ribosome maturation factor RimP [Clostridia bacterium]